MQYLLVCLVALLNLALDALPTTSYSNEAARISSTRQLSQSQHHVAPQHTGLVTGSDDLYTIDAIKYAPPSNLIARDGASVRSAQADCYIRDPDDVRIQFTDGILAMITNVPSDDFPYDLSISGAEIYCTIPPSGTCAPCERNTTNVEVKYAKPNSWCFFLFSSEFGGTSYESFYVHWYQGLVTLHNPGFIKLVMCHDEDESKKKRQISAEGNATTAVAQGGCNFDPDSYEIELSMGSTTFSTSIPSDGNDHRLGQPNPGLNCTSSGQCSYCTDQAETVTLRNAPEGAHCDLLFTQNVEGGYIFGMSVPQGPDPVVLPKPGTLAVAKCFKPDLITENWISRLQAPYTEAVQVTPIESAISPESRSLSVRDDLTGCVHSDGDKLVPLFFGTADYNFTTWVPVDGKIHALGQPTPDLKCRREHEGVTVCVECWAPVTWVTVPAGFETPNCVLTLTNDLEGNSRADITLDKTLFLWRMANEMSLALVICKPASSAISKRQTFEAAAEPSTSLEVIESSQMLPTAIKRNPAAPTDVTCQLTNGEVKSTFVLHGGKGIESTIEVKNDGQWHVFGDTVDADVMCYENTGSFVYCDYCQHHIDYLIIYSQVGITCHLSITPASDEGIQFPEVQFDMTGPLTTYNIVQGDNYYFKVKCGTDTSKMTRDTILAGRNTSDSNPVETVAVSGGIRDKPLLGALVPLALLPLVGIN